MSKIKTWLLERFLPAWAKDTVYQDNKRRVYPMKTVTINDREIPVVGYVDGNKTIPILDLVVSDEVWDDVRYWPVCLLAAEEKFS